jgi:DNA invertase Pin-like site-specific DNA recombinase
MAQGKFVAYYRVSTTRQGQSGLSLEAQRNAVTDFLDGGTWQLAAEVVEVESGKRSDRPKLQEALRLCRLMEQPWLSPSLTASLGTSPSSPI